MTGLVIQIASSLMAVLIWVAQSYNMASSAAEIGVVRTVVTQCANAFTSKPSIRRPCAS